jgi:hypothetical protein
MTYPAPPTISALAILILAAVAGLAQTVPARGAPARKAGTPQNQSKDILDMDIEQLGKVDVRVPWMNVEVTTIRRTESTVGRSRSAVFVITPEMIRRSGATSIPEVLHNTTMDLRLGWRPSDCIKAAIVGQNLLAAHHFEFFGADAPATEVDRRLYGTVTWCY